MSAKLRMTLYTTFMVMLLCIAMLVFVLVLNARDFTDDPADYLVNRVVKNANEIEYEHGHFDWGDVKTYRRGVHSSFYAEDGSVLLSAMTPDMDVSDIPFRANDMREITIGDEAYYLYDYYLEIANSGIWVRGIVSQTAHTGVMNALVKATIAILPSVLVLSFLGSYFIAWLTFRPLTKITSAAEEISYGDDLSERINLKRGAKEFKKLSLTFDRMFDRLESDFNAQKQFASDASHELRTPITVVLAECEYAKKKANTKEDFVESIDVIQQQTERMSNLVQELLSLTRMQQGTERYPLQEENLSEFILACLEDYLPADTRGIKMQMDIEKNIRGNFNASLFSRLLINLLQNAYKYGKENGHIYVSLHQEEQTIILKVRDDGIGISKENQSKIFDRFWQANTARGDDGSTGLGLAMVKEIAEFHGGSIQVDSELGEGSCLTVTLPCSI